MWSWTKWLLCRLAEFGFEKVPDEVLDKLEKWSRGWMTTHFNEEAVKVIRVNGSAAMNGVSTRSMRWVALLSNQKLAKDGPRRFSQLPKTS